MLPQPSDSAFPEGTSRFGAPVRVLALIVVIALIILTVVPLVVQVTRSEPAGPTTTMPGIVAMSGLELGSGNL
jgi:hypothetical protein